MKAVRALVAIAALLLLSSVPSFGQSSPGLRTGQVPTAAQWNSYFAAKQDVLNYLPVNKAGDLMQGFLGTTASSASRAGFNLLPGTAPSSPNDGDVWITASGFYARVNGSTVGPIGDITANNGADFRTVSLTVTLANQVNIKDYAGSSTIDDCSTNATTAYQAAYAALIAAYPSGGRILFPEPTSSSGCYRMGPFTAGNGTWSGNNATAVATEQNIEITGVSATGGTSSLDGAARSVKIRYLASASNGADFLTVNGPGSFALRDIEIDGNSGTVGHIAGRALVTKGVYRSTIEHVTLRDFSGTGWRHIPTTTLPAGLVIGACDNTVNDLLIISTGYAATDGALIGAADDTAGTYDVCRDKIRMSVEITDAPVATASITGTTLTVTAITPTSIAVGDDVAGPGVSPGTVVTALGSGTGGNGTYTVNISQTVGSAALIITHNRAVTVRGADLVNFEGGLWSSPSRTAVALKILPPTANAILPQNITMTGVALVGPIAIPASGVWTCNASGAAFMAQGVYFNNLPTGDLMAAGAGQSSLPISPDGCVQGFTSDGRRLGSEPNAQTGTSYTVVSSDNHKLVTFSNASSIAVTLPQATLFNGFGPNWMTYVQNIGVGLVTITPTTSTINGAATLTLATGQGALIWSDATPQYKAMTVYGGAVGQIPGTRTNDTAAAGAVGEVLSCSASGGTATVTITIASPAVITDTAHGLDAYSALTFTNSGGALPTGITSGTTYYLVPINANSYSIATTVANAIAGTKVNTSGSQSGTQTRSSTVTLGTGTPADVCGFQLTAGDWDVWGIGSFTGAASTTVSYIYAGVNSVSATQAAATTRMFYNSVTAYNVTNIDAPIISRPIQVSSLTTYFLVVRSGFGVSTSSGFGTMYARRRR